MSDYPERLRNFNKAGQLQYEWFNEVADHIDELEAEKKRLNEQMDAIEEMGTESLNALPDCLMRLAPALVENDDLKAKLAKAVEALDEAVYLLAPDDKDMARKAGVYRIVTTLAELKGQDDE